MSNTQRTAVVALYADQPHAIADFEGLVALSADLVVDVPFDAAVASKKADGDVDIVQTHIGLRDHLGTEGAGTGLAIGALAALLPGVGPAGLAAGLAAGGAGGAAANLTIDHTKHRAFIEAATSALDRGESLLCVVCSPPDAERFDQLMNGAQRVVQLDLDDPGAADT